MERANVLQRVRSIIGLELDDRSLCITDDTAVGELPDWDRVAHFRIVIAIENASGFSSTSKNTRSSRRSATR
jgi:hypothetical protein